MFGGGPGNYENGGVGHPGWTAARWQLRPAEAGAERRDLSTHPPGRGEEQSFEETSIAQIVARAGCSEGPFYARFGDKETFLRHLEEYFFSEREKAIQAVEDRGPDGALDPRETIRESLRLVIQQYRRLHGIYGALVLRSRRDPALRARLRELDRGHLKRTSTCLARVIGSQEQEDEAVAFGLFVVRSAVRQAVVFGDSWAGEGQGPDEALADALSRLLMGYLERRKTHGC